MVEQIQYPDPAYRFTLVYKDGREMSQEDEAGHVVRDHCHIEDPHNVEIYSLRNRPGDHVISVNFSTGVFSINGQKVRMMISDMDLITNQNQRAVFEPIMARTNVSGEFGKKTFFKCGWKTKVDNKEYVRCLLVSEQGEVFVLAD